MTQRVFVELDDVGHDVGCSVVAEGDQMRAAVDAFDPELVIAPYLKTAIPDDVWRTHTCLIVHPGIRGDRGPSSLDWAILRGLPSWGVTVLQAAEEFDAGDIWAHREFPMSGLPKSAVYRHQVADAAVDALLEAIDRFRSGASAPEPLDYRRPEIKGRLEASMKQADREIDWSAPTAVILRQLRCSDSTPGVLDNLFGTQYYLFGGHEEQLLRGQPGEVIARRGGAICRATGDGAVWISHLKKAETGDRRKTRTGDRRKSRTGDRRKRRTGNRTPVKLPAAVALAAELGDVPDLPLPPDQVVETRTYREIWYEERAEVGYVHFEFYNGAMSTEQCLRLRDAYQLACRRSTKVIVLMGGRDLWSNGIHLNVIEAADEPHEESWANINAMDDLVHEILDTDSHVVVSALAGNAGAGGVPLALAADEVCARPGVVLNPHYKGMELFGSEYWTYLFPRRVGQERTAELTETCLPISARQAKDIGLIDHVVGRDVTSFHEQVKRLAEAIAHGDDLAERLRQKSAARHHDERIRPLDGYRYEELGRMEEDFSAAGYHSARKAFVHKRPLEPFTHPAAVGPVIRSVRASTAQGRPTDQRPLTDPRPLVETSATHEDGSALQVLYEENGRVAAASWEWRRKAILMCSIVVTVLLALAAWIYKEDLGLIVLSVPFAFGAAIAAVCGVFDRRNGQILDACVEVGRELEGRLSERDPQAQSPSGIYAAIAASWPTKATSGHDLSRAYVALASSLGAISLGTAFAGSIAAIG